MLKLGSSILLFVSITSFNVKADERIGSSTGVFESDRVIWDSTSTQRTNTDTKPLHGIGSKAESACEIWHKGASPPIAFSIIAGNHAYAGEFPHMAALGFPPAESELDYKFYCGGSLISNNFVLTAAHCVNKPDSRPVIVRLGKLTINSNEDHIDPVDIEISEIITHNLYTRSRKYHDIALIRLGREIAFSDVIRPACLQVDTNDIGTDVELVETGWGRPDPNILLKANFKSVPFQICNDEYKTLSSINTRSIPDGVIEGILCARDYNPNEQSCSISSGGPLQILSNRSQVSTIVGVVSFGIGCGGPVPDGFTRVSYYMQWIESNVWP